MSNYNMDDYVPVNERIAAFYAAHPEGSLQADIVERTEDRVTVKAYAYRTPDDPRPGTGLSSERIPGATNFTKGSELENAETSAWGRAIAALGFEVKRGIASREEMQRNNQPWGGERSTRTHGRRSESRQAATTRPTAQRTPEEEELRDRILSATGGDEGRMRALADSAGVPKGERATLAQLEEMVALIETAQSEGSPDSSVSGSDAPTAPAAVSPAAAGAGLEPTLDDVLAATGGELIPPRPGTDGYKAMSPTDRATARAYWQREDAKPQPTLAEAMGGVTSD